MARWQLLRWTLPLVFLFITACTSDAPAPGFGFLDGGEPLSPEEDSSDTASDTPTTPGFDSVEPVDTGGPTPFDVGPDAPPPPLDSDNDGTPDDEDCAPEDPEIHPAAIEVCNGVDDDCDEGVDEDIEDLSCGAGVCQTVVPACAFGVPVTCVPLAVAKNEVCDGLDNNCDGFTDEGFEVLTCGAGACGNVVYPCLDGSDQFCVPLEPTDEVCDGLDNDCNGGADEELPDQTCGLGVCEITVPGCVEGEIPQCEPLEEVTEEVCDGLDNDCDGAIDEELGETTCGAGPCQLTVQNCIDGAPQTCVPLPVPAGTCDAPPAPCKTTTTGADACSNPCSKVGPAACYIVHTACLTSNPGSSTDATHCTTPMGKYNCGLTCQEWPNTIGADCTYCVNIHCTPKSGLDQAQFYCANYPAPPTE